MLTGSSGRGAGVTVSDAPGVKERVQTYLTSQGPITVDDKGRFGIDIGSTHVFVQVLPHGDEKATLVMVTAPILFEVPLTPELYRHVAVHADDWWFGHLFLIENEGATTGTLIGRHTLLGDYLDKDELLYAVNGVGYSADGADDELQKQFGGKRYEDS